MLGLLVGSLLDDSEKTQISFAVIGTVAAFVMIERGRLKEKGEQSPPGSDPLFPFGAFSSDDNDDTDIGIDFDGDLGD